MTKPQIRSAMTRRLSEFFDGYVMVGRVAGTGKIVIVAEVPSDPDQSEQLSVAMLCVVGEMQKPAGPALVT